MSHSFKLSRRIARLRAPVLAAALIFAFVGCDSADSLNPEGSTDPTQAGETPIGDEGSVVEEIPITDASDDAPVAEDAPGVEGVESAPLVSASFAGGIPIGIFHQPNSTFGGTYNGALRNIWPQWLVENLAQIRVRGAKVALMFAGHEKFYKDANGHFSFSKWKARIDRFKGVNFNSYINDGTVIGHYLIDEPQDPFNWNGRPIPQSTIEEMARYSKQLWPNMVTIVRSEPGYMAKWSGSYRYLDAAWAQYVVRRGDVNAFLQKNVADAQRKGLALVVGLNISMGSQSRGRMSASQVQSLGSAMLKSSYPCAFISWQYDAGHLASSSMKAAMQSLRSKAQNRSFKTCRGS